MEGARKKVPMYHLTFKNKTALRGKSPWVVIVVYFRVPMQRKDCKGPQDTRMACSRKESGKKADIYLHYIAAFSGVSSRGSD